MRIVTDLGDTKLSQLIFSKKGFEIVPFEHIEELNHQNIFAIQMKTILDSA